MDSDLIRMDFFSVGVCVRSGSFDGKGGRVYSDIEVIDYLV